uniref:Transmembrane protein 230 n=1 Tax=Oryza glaberrima TaxID=4538 RepID=I1NXS6_ORYGL
WRTWTTPSPSPTRTTSSAAPWGPRGAPVKEIAFAAALLAFGALGAIGGVLMAANNVGGDRAHGIFFMILGIVMFIPGFYYTRIAYYAYKGYKGFSFSNIPPI